MTPPPRSTHSRASIAWHSRSLSSCNFLISPAVTLLGAGFAFVVACRAADAAEEVARDAAALGAPRAADEDAAGAADEDAREAEVRGPDERRFERPAGALRVSRSAWGAGRDGAIGSPPWASARIGSCISVFI